MCQLQKISNNYSGINRSSFYRQGSSIFTKTSFFIKNDSINSKNSHSFHVFSKKLDVILILLLIVSIVIVILLIIKKIKSEDTKDQDSQEKLLEDQFQSDNQEIESALSEIENLKMSLNKRPNNNKKLSIERTILQLERKITFLRSKQKK